MPNPKRLEEAREWLRYSSEDLDTAELLLCADPPKIKQSLFHAQQAVEKALKGFLVWNDREYPLSHSLPLLADLCGEYEPSISEELASALWLTQFAVRFRYPGGFTEPEIEDARQALQSAGSACRAILALFPA